MASEAPDPRNPTPEQVPRRLCLIVDTNIWISHLMLRSPTAAGLLFLLRQIDGVIGLPHVVEEELRRHAVTEGEEALRMVNEGLAQLRRLLGTAPEPSLPGPQRLQDATDTRLEEIDYLIERVPLTFEQTTDALTMVLDCVPPNQPKNQQFKDSLLWVAALGLARHFEVILVTHDKGFFDKRTIDRGLAPELTDAARVLGVEPITVVYELSDALELLATPSHVDEDSVVAQIETAMTDMRDEHAERSEFRVGPRIRAEASCYATEDPEALAVTFTLEYQLNYLGDAGLYDGRLETGGECMIVKGEVGELRPKLLRATWTEASGETSGAATAIIGAAAGIIGERHTPYTVRHEVHTFTHDDDPHGTPVESGEAEGPDPVR